MQNKENAKNNPTELVFVLDRSGSMHGLEQDTVDGFNSMLEKQKKEAGKVFVSTVLFADTAEVLHDRADLQAVEPMTEKTYFVGGCTALLDALGGAIHHIGNIHKYACPEDVPAHTLFVIITDGLENASRHYSADRVKQMVRHEQEQHGWEFLFLGANIDAVETAAHFGIGADRAVTYCSDSAGTQLNYDVVSDTVSMMRASLPLSADWKARIENDMQNRRKK